MMHQSEDGGVYEIRSKEMDGAECEFADRGEIKDAPVPMLMEIQS